MTDKDKEIIKALECCGKFGSFVCDEKCPMFKSKCETLSDCRLKLHKLSLDLIKRQQAEIEQLKKDKDGLAVALANAVGRNVGFKEDIERLQNDLAAKITEHSLLEREKAKDISGFVDDLKTARAEAIKGFADMFVEKFITLFNLNYEQSEAARENKRLIIKAMVGEDK